MDIKVDPQQSYEEGKSAGYLLSCLDKWAKFSSVPAKLLFAAFSLLPKQLTQGAYLDLSLSVFCRVLDSRCLFAEEPKSQIPDWGEVKDAPNKEALKSLADLLIAKECLELSEKLSLEPLECLSASCFLSGSFYEGIADGYMEEGEGKEKAVEAFLSLYGGSRENKAHFQELLSALERIYQESQI